MLLSFFLPRAHCYHAQLAVCQQHTGSIQQSCLLIRHSCCQGFFLPSYRTWHWSLLSSIGFLLAHSSSLSASLGQPCSWLYWLLVLDYNDILVSSANQVRLFSVFDWGSLINMLKRTCTRTDTCSAPLVTGL